MAAGLSIITAMLGAAATSDGSVQGLTRFAKIDPSLYLSDGQYSGFTPAVLGDQPVSVVLEMSGAPVAKQDADTQKQQGRKLSDDEKHAIRQQLASQQDQLDGELAAAEAHVVGKMQDAYNGIHVIVPQKNLPRLAALKGVTAVHAVPTFTPSNVNGLPYIGAPQAWGGFNLTGKGVKVGIIDTGIDYTHADFGGPGTVAAWSAAKATSTAPPDPALVGPSAPKVKGGFDFVGDAYNAQIPGSVPVPDPNPLDCFGHGTHTAGSLAGFGVLSTGATFNGPYEANTISGHSWNVGPGVAPEAHLYVYRVFGCAGSSRVVDLAINRAVADHVDVISMSLGSPLGGTTDPTSVAAQNAFEDGIAVVASAGNNGTAGYLVGSPSTVSGVLSVAAIDASFQQFQGATISPTTPPVKAINANLGALPVGAKKVQVLKNPDGSVSLGCNESEYANSQDVIVVTMRGNCARVARAVFGDKHHAAAVVMINTSNSYPPFEGPITSNPDTGEQRNVTIPFLGVKLSDQGALVAADGTMVTLAPTLVPNVGYTAVASFTSGGPRNPDSAPKPDVAAPGVSVASAGMGTGNAAVYMSGTSMACPMTAGIAALVKEAHPTWKSEEIKAAIMNTADSAKNGGYNVRLTGTGVVQAQKAVNSSVLATTEDNLDSIAFGYVPGTGTYEAHKTFTLDNRSGKDATYDLSVKTNGPTQFGAVVTVAPGQATVPAHETMDVNVSLSMPAAAFAALPSDDTGAIGPGGVLTARGDIVAKRDVSDTALDHQTLTLPYMLVPRGVSNVAPGEANGWSNGDGNGTPGRTISATLPLSNNGIHSGTADLFAWGITSGQTDGQPNDVRDVGLQVLPASALVQNPLPNDRALVFAINTWGRSANQSINEYDIPISVNGSGKTDFVVAGADLGAVLGGSYNGVFASFTVDAHTHALVDAFVADAPMNGSIVELPTLASDLGLAPKANGPGPVKKQGITYSVFAINRVPGAAPKVTGSTTFNPYSPSVSSGNFALLGPGQTSSFVLSVDTDQQKAQPTLGWLVVSIDNANGAPQAREVAAPDRSSQEKGKK